MKDELISKGIEAFLTGARVLGEETKTLISEVINYLMFCAVLDFVKTFVWGLFGLAIYKIIKALLKSYVTENEAEIAEYTKEDDEAEMKEKAKGDKAVFPGGFPKGNFAYARNNVKRIEIRRTNNTQVTIIANAISLGIALFWSCYSIEKLRPVGKILTAPRLVLIQEGAHLINTLKQKEQK
jgi:hypothetical protein